MTTPPTRSAPRWTSVLKVFTDIRPVEVRGTLTLTLNFFLLFTAYYVLKPIREGLILSLDGGAEIKAWATSIQALLFIAVVPLYSRMVNRFAGRTVIIAIYLFMAVNVLLIMLLGFAEFRYLGVAYFVWLGFFNLLTISQTWSLCSELYSTETGKRNFPLIGLGAAAGAALGSMVLRSVVPHIGLFKPMAIAAALLVVCAMLVRWGVPKRRPLGVQLAERDSAPPPSPLGGVAMVFKSRYIALIAALILITNLINTNSEYMLGRLVSDHFRSLASAGMAQEHGLRDAIGGFYAELFFWVNISVLVLQAFAVSRIIRHGGVRLALLVMPALAFVSYSLIIFLPILAVVRLVKIAENASDYSLNNTAREILFLPLSTDDKYKAKLAADTIFRRIGDALSGPTVSLIVTTLGLGVAAFSGVNVALVLIWFWLVWKIGVKRRMMIDKSAR